MLVLFAKGVQVLKLTDSVQILERFTKKCLKLSKNCCSGWRWASFGRCYFTLMPGRSSGFGICISLCLTSWTLFLCLIGDAKGEKTRSEQSAGLVRRIRSTGLIGRHFLTAVRRIGLAD